MHQFSYSALLLVARLSYRRIGQIVGKEDLVPEVDVWLVAYTLVEQLYEKDLIPEEDVSLVACDF